MNSLILCCNYHNIKAKKPRKIFNLSMCRWNEFQQLYANPSSSIVWQHLNIQSLKGYGSICAIIENVNNNKFDVNGSYNALKVYPEILEVATLRKLLLTLKNSRNPGFYRMFDNANHNAFRWGYFCCQAVVIDYSDGR